MLGGKQNGFISGDIIAIVIAGVALGGLLIYGSQTGQELPVWPAIAVVLVNLVAAGRVIWSVNKAKKLQQEQRANASKTEIPPR